VTRARFTRAEVLAFLERTSARSGAPVHLDDDDVATTVAAILLGPERNRRPRRGADQYAQTDRHLAEEDGRGER
jgi:hypothetical protein